MDMTIKHIMKGFLIYSYCLDEEYSRDRMIPFGCISKVQKKDSKIKIAFKNNTSVILNVTAEQFKVFKTNYMEYKVPS